MGVSGLAAPTEPRPGCDRTPTAPRRLNPGPRSRKHRNPRCAPFLKGHTWSRAVPGWSWCCDPRSAAPIPFAWSCWAIATPARVARSGRL